MPLHTVKVDGKTMYKWGKSGKLYSDKSKAMRQGRAIEASKARRAGKEGPRVY